MFITAIFLIVNAILALIVFIIDGDTDCLFYSLAFGTIGIFIFVMRAKIWDKNIIKFNPNIYFWLSILVLLLLECIFIYLFYYTIDNNVLSKIEFFNKYGETFTILLISMWIVTLYNLKE